MENKAKNILLTGGGTAGSVSPLLAIVEDLKKSGGCEFLFIGTKNGVERRMVEAAGLPYRAIAAGKLRRYFDWRNLSDVFRIKLGFWQALFLILKERPDLVLSAGSFVSVPVVWAAWLLRVPIFVHQQDVRPGLANRLMAPFAKIITVTFERSLADYGKKAVWTGNPHRFPISDFRFSIEKARERFKLKDNLPVVFVFGGGTGAEGINRLVEEGLDSLLSFCQIVHSTGQGKMTAKRHEDYHPYEFLNAEEMAMALAAADLVVSRAGLGALTEIAAAGKPAIIIPLPDSHQEDNAALLLEKESAIVLNQKVLDSDSFVAAVKELLDNAEKRKILSENIGGLMKKGASEKIISLIKETL